MNRASRILAKGSAFRRRHFRHQIQIQRQRRLATTASADPKTSAYQQKEGTSDTLRPYIKDETTHFGFTDVPVSAKEDRVRAVFENVADSYDQMNDLMSGGLHRVWKDRLLQASAVEAIAGAVRRAERAGAEFKILDVAGGTGDVAFRFLEAAGCAERSESSGADPVQITVCDINKEMLRVGEQRAVQRYGRDVMETSQALRFVQGNAQALDNFDDESFDLYTIAFGLRNVTDVDAALKEAHRVLKPGGRFMCLEFSQVSNQYFRAIYDAYSFNMIPSMGDIVAGDRDSYQYLVESIRKFSNQEELLQRMQQASFQNCKYTNWTGGIVALHEGWKSL